MQNFEWRLKRKTDTEYVYEIKDGSLSSDYIKDCTVEENRRINERSQTMWFNPKPGFYQIKDVHLQKKYNSEEDEFAARYAYKETIEKKFVDLGTNIRLQPFFNEASEGENQVKERFLNNPAGLVDKVIQVQSWELVESSYQGKSTKVNKVKWLILNDEVISRGIPGLTIASEEEMDKIYYSEDFEAEDLMEEYDPQEEEIYGGEDFE